MIRPCAITLVVCGLLMPPVGAQRARLQGSDGLNGAKLQPAKLDGARLEGGRLEPATGLKPEALGRLSIDLVRGGLTPGKLEGALSSLPPSRLGEVFFGVARELETLEGGVTHTAVGYYMAALTNPEGELYQAAKRRLHEILLDVDLEHERAVALYDGGLETFGNLCASGLGIQAEGIRKSLLDLSAIKRAYRTRRGE